jgi:flagellar hook-length control protein FliK
MTAPSSSASPTHSSGADVDDPFLAVLAGLLAPGFVGIPPASEQATTLVGNDRQSAVGTLPPAGVLQQSAGAIGDGSQPSPPRTAISAVVAPSASVEPEALPAEMAAPSPAEVSFTSTLSPVGRLTRKAHSEATFLTSDPDRSRSPELDRHEEVNPASHDGRKQDGGSVVPDGGLMVQPSGSSIADRGPVELALGAGGASVDPTTVSAETAASPSSNRSSGPPPVPLGLADHQGRPVTVRLLATEAGDGRRLRIQLDPADLGRVEVTLRLDHTGTAAAVFTVDRPETLLLLQRDARAITDVLSSAGYTLDPGSVGFTLRDGNGEDARPHQPLPAAPEPRGCQDELGTVEAVSPTWTRQGLLDLHV